MLKKTVVIPVVAFLLGGLASAVWVNLIQSDGEQTKTRYIGLRPWMRIIAKMARASPLWAWTLCRFMKKVKAGKTL